MKEEIKGWKSKTKTGVGEGKNGDSVQQRKRVGVWKKSKELCKGRENCSWSTLSH